MRRCGRRAACRARKPSTSPPRASTCLAALAVHRLALVPAAGAGAVDQQLVVAPDGQSRAAASSRSAIGERQMLPMHTCRTVNGGMAQYCSMFSDGTGSSESRRPALR